MGNAPPANKPGLLDLDDPTELEASAPGDDLSLPTAPPQFAAEKLFEEAEFRERMQTITDEYALEQARMASIASVPPPAKPPANAQDAMGAEEPEPMSVRLPPPAADFPPMRQRAPSVEILAGEEDLDELGSDEQIAILRARLAPLTRVPSLARSLSELGQLLDDPKMAYVLGFVDGVLPFETIVEVTGLPELDTLRVLDKVVAQGLFVYGKRP